MDIKDCESFQLRFSLLWLYGLTNKIDWTVFQSSQSDEGNEKRVKWSKKYSSFVKHPMFYAEII